MLPLVHAMGGVLVYAGLVWTGAIPGEIGLLPLGVFVALLPDIDALTGVSLADHHRSPLHAPLFWVVVAAAVAVFSPVLALLVAVEAMGHLFGDWVAGRTTGIPLAYPASHAEYSAFETRPAKGSFSVYDLDRATLWDYLAFYVENRAVVVFEVCVFLAGLAALLSV